MISQYLSEITLLIDRLKAKTSGFKSIGPLEDIIIGGDIEAKFLPACLIGDARALLNSRAKGSGNYVKTGDYFLMIVVENGPGSYAIADQLLTDSINAVLFDSATGPYPRWIPDGCDGPFELAPQQPGPIYDETRTARTLLFNLQAAIK